MDGFSWKQWRKNAPVPPTDIPYGPYSVALENGNVYSIDKFRPRFPFEVARHRPDQREGREGLFLPVTDDDRVAAVSELLRQSNVTVGEFQIIRHDSGRFGGNVLDQSHFDFFGLYSNSLRVSGILGGVEIVP